MKKLAMFGIVSGLLLVCLVSFTAEMKSKGIYGYLSDKLCSTTSNGISADGANMKTNPENHTVSCMLVDSCSKSGFGLMIKGKDGMYTFTKFDKNGNEKALTLLKNTKRQNGMYVEVSGKKIKNEIIVSSIAEKEMPSQ